MRKPPAGLDVARAELGRLEADLFILSSEGMSASGEWPRALRAVRAQRLAVIALEAKRK